MSFYYLGSSEIVCAVSKYNSLTNQFKKICQTSEKISVSENPQVASRRPIIRKEQAKAHTLTKMDRYKNQITYTVGPNGKSMILEKKNLKNDKFTSNKSKSNVT